MDHAGGLRFFPHSRIHLQRAKLRWARHPDTLGAAGLLRSNFDHRELTYELHEWDARIVDGVHAVPLSWATAKSIAACLAAIPSTGWLVTSAATPRPWAGS